MLLTEFRCSLSPAWANCSEKQQHRELVQDVWCRRNRECKVLHCIMRNAMNPNQKYWPRWNRPPEGKAEGNYLGSTWERGLRQSGTSCQRTQNLNQETENVRETLRAPDKPGSHGSSTPMKHAFPQGDLRSCTAKGLTPFTEKWNRKLRSGTSGGKRQRVGKHIPNGVWSTSWGSHVVIWGCFGREQRVSWEELEEGPVLHLQTCGEDFPRDMDVLQEKVQRYLLDIWTKAGEANCPQVSIV